MNTFFNNLRKAACFLFSGTIKYVIIEMKSKHKFLFA